MIAASQAVDRFSNADALVATGVALRVESNTVTVGQRPAGLLPLTASDEVAARHAEIRRELREGAVSAARSN